MVAFVEHRHTTSPAYIPSITSSVYNNQGHQNTQPTDRGQKQKGRDKAARISTPQFIMKFLKDRS
ncbi:hypothetical protein NC653_014029 [Populus alba x Populus x berolinensis]|uniref:Uncharacterized protein n=1 Tax=Populus alba x Populus x berolinensis TaxID=444605 RepID=A0AAD6W3T2_9ROSI|nr:hypothetical protein NC653_014029 [Populus alba x Populus x berolinensis]